MADEEQIPAMPEDFAAIPPTQAWERVQRERRGRARVEADLATTRERLGSLEQQLSEAAPLRERLSALEAELAQERAAREAATLRVPLVRAGIEDDEVADLLVQRWRGSQAQVEEGKRQDLATWLREAAPADKIAARLLPGAQTAAAAPPRVNAGTESVAPPPGDTVTLEEFRREAAMGPGYSERMLQYIKQQGRSIEGLARRR